MGGALSCSYARMLISLFTYRLERGYARPAVSRMSSVQEVNVAKRKVARFVPITERALVQRLRRALARDGDRLIANRRPWEHGPANVGRYYIVDKRNIMTDHDVDLVALGREVGVMRPWEQLFEERAEYQKEK